MIFTHPGRFGDLIWALPTVRALGGGLLWLPESLRPMEPLLRAQPYIRDVVFDETWQVQDTAPATPRVPPDFLVRAGRGPFCHLGYREWPDRPLPEYVARLAGAPIDLSQPWLTAPATRTSPVMSRFDVLVSFTDRWFELKYGLLALLQEAHVGEILLTYRPDTRWDGPIAPSGVYEAYSGWDDLPARIARARLVVCDNSAIMVLCAAFQTTPCLVLEPEEARHHPIFWPGIQGGDDGPERWRPREPLCRWIHPLLGGDGRPTFDSRHLIATVRRLLDERLGMEADRG